MATAKKEQIGVEMLVQFRADPRSAAKIIKDTADVQKKVSKQLSKLKLDLGQVAKQSNVSLGHIKDISTAASAFSKQLSHGAQTWAKSLGDLGDQLEDAHEKAAQFEKQLSKARTPGAKREAASNLGAVQKQIVGLNKQIAEHRKTGQQYGRELGKIVRAQRDFRVGLEKTAKYTGSNFLRDVMSSLGKIPGGGAKGVAAAGSGIASASGRLASGVVARRAKAGGAGTPGAGGGAAALGQTAVAMSKAVGQIAGAASALLAIVNLIKTASDHMATLNKAMLEGSTLAGDSALSAAKYAKVMKNLRDTAVGLNLNWMKFGVVSEDGLKAVAAFSKETSGSLAQTQARMKMMGGDIGEPLEQGMNSFVIAAKTYGNALGLSLTETAGMMGEFVNEIGVTSEGVQGTLKDITAQAAASNIPIYKFMDMFRQAMPSLDLYINRMEELTGVIKLLGKAMSPGDVKKFMDAFRQGFDQMDFKQRLKIGLVAGIGDVNKILKENFEATGAGLADKMGKFGNEFKSAMKAADPVAAVRKVVGKAMASGEVEAATLGAAQKLARSERLRKRGGATNIAGAMRGAGLMGRLEILEKAAGKLTGGNIEGLGEHVAKQITGMSEQQYAGILQLQDSMGNYMAQLNATGRTSSTSINKNLMKILGVSSDVDLEKKMLQLAKNDPKKAEKYVKQAAVMQIEEETNQGDAMQNLSAEQVDATYSIGDKIENVIKVLLEKLYWVLNDIYGWLGSSLWGWLTGSDAQKETNQYLAGMSRDAERFYKDDPKKAKAVKDNLAQLQLLNSQGASNEQITSKMSGLLMDSQMDPDAVKNMAAVVGGDAGKRFEELMNKGGSRTGEENVELNEILKGMDQQKLLRVMAQAAMKSSKVQEMQYKESEKQRKTKTGKELADAKAEVDKRTQYLYEHPEEAGKAGKASGKVRTGTTTVEHMKLKADVAAKPAPKPSKTSPEGRALEQNKETTEATEASGEAVTDSVEKSSADQIKQMEDVYGGITDVVGILKKGIMFYPGFLMGPYKSTIKEATFDSFQKALIGFAVLQAKMAEHPELQKAMSDYGWQTITSGVGFEKLSTVGADTMKDPNAYAEWLKKQKEEGGRQMGGPIPDTGMYKLHKGEAVLDSMTYESVKRGLRDGGGGTGNVVVNVHAAPNWSQQQFENAVVNVMDRVSRRQ